MAYGNIAMVTWIHIISCSRAHSLSERAICGQINPTYHGLFYFYYWTYIILKSAIKWYNNLQLSGGLQCMFRSSWLVTMGNLYFAYVSSN